MDRTKNSLIIHEEKISAGTLRVYRNADQTNMPGITVMLQPKGTDTEIDLIWIESVENPDAVKSITAHSGKKLDLRKGDIIVHSYMDAGNEDATDVSLIRADAVADVL